MLSRTPYRVTIQQYGQATLAGQSRTFFCLEIVGQRSPLHGGFLRPSSVPLALAPTPSYGAICTPYRVRSNHGVHSARYRVTVCTQERSSSCRLVIINVRDKAPYFVTAEDDLLVARPALWKRPWSPCPAALPAPAKDVPARAYLNGAVPSPSDTSPSVRITTASDK